MKNNLLCIRFVEGVLIALICIQQPFAVAQNTATFEDLNSAKSFLTERLNTMQYAGDEKVRAALDILAEQGKAEDRQLLFRADMFYRIDPPPHAVANEGGMLRFAKNFLLLRWVSGTRVNYDLASSITMDKRPALRCQGFTQSVEPFEKFMQCALFATLSSNSPMTEGEPWEDVTILEKTAATGQLPKADVDEFLATLRLRLHGWYVYPVDAFKGKEMDGRLQHGTWKALRKLNPNIPWIQERFRKEDAGLVAAPAEMPPPEAYSENVDTITNMAEYKERLRLYREELAAQKEQKAHPESSAVTPNSFPWWIEWTAGGLLLTSLLIAWRVLGNRHRRA